MLLKGARNRRAKGCDSGQVSSSRPRSISPDCTTSPCETEADSQVIVPPLLALVQAEARLVKRQTVAPSTNW